MLQQIVNEAQTVREYLKYFKKINGYRKKLKDELSSLTEIGEKLSREEIGNIYKVIFSKINAEFCSNCPHADYLTVQEAQKNDSYLSKESGCCSLCSKWKGYLSKYKISVEKFNKFGFNKKYGFFDPIRKTCKLPHKLRSAVCLRFVCGHIKKYIPKLNNSILILLNDLINKKDTTQEEWDKV